MRRLMQPVRRKSLVGKQSGRVKEGADPFGPNRIELLVILRPYSEGGRVEKSKRMSSWSFPGGSEHIRAAAFNFTQPIMDIV